MTPITDQRPGLECDQLRHGTDAVTDHGGLMIPHRAAKAGRPGLSKDELASMMSVAARAPSVHNTQPWKFRSGPDGIDLLADPERMLRTIDPVGRELVISCGAALFGLRLGLRRIGRLPAVELQPDPSQPWLLARVGAAGHAAPTREEADMIAAVPHRHTHRGPFSPGEVPDRLLEMLATDAAAEGCELLIVTDSVLLTRLERLARRAAAQQQASAEISAELHRWLRPADSQAKDGVPIWARAAGAARPARARGAVAGGRSHKRASPVPGEQLARRDFGLPGTAEAGGAAPSATMVLLTATDAPVDWLRAGQALDRVLLRAAARWVFARLQSQPLESIRHRDEVRSLIGHGGYPQMLMQFGRANIAPATPRRAHAELLAGEPQA